MKKREWLIQLNKETGIVLFRLAKESGVSYNSLLRIKKGETKTIQMETLKKIADGFKLPFEKVLNFENEYQDPETENLTNTEVLILLKKERKIPRSFCLGTENFEVISQKKLKEGLLLSVNKKKGN